MLLALFAYATVCQIVDGFQPEAKVIGGQYSNISDFSYAASLLVRCIREEKLRYWSCGSSILNQYIMLTAAHCTRGCEITSYMIASVGSNQIKGPNVYRVHSYIRHSNYTMDPIANDIAILRLSTELKFGPEVGRVILLPNPPYYEKAYVAGWGRISADPVHIQHGDLLKSVEQYVIDMSECKKNRSRTIPNGTICAASTNVQEHPAKGDSGAALVVPPNIQIGVVSFKQRNRYVMFYADIGYFYDWIQTTARTILCSDDDVVCFI